MLPGYKRKNLVQNSDDSLKCFLQKFLFGNHQPILFDAEMNNVYQGLWRAGFGKKLKNVPCVDRVNGFVKIGIAGEHHSHGIGCDFFNPAEKFNAVHFGHLEVGYNDGIRSAVSDGFQPFFGSLGGIQMKFFS